MQDINRRLDGIEERLFEIERKLGIGKTAPLPQAVAAAVAAVKQEVRSTASQAAADEWTEDEPQRPPREPVSATRALAWCAGLTFLLAMVYFLKLVYDAGWLTPMRQLGLAYSAAMVLMALGLWLEDEDRQYAAYLPAVGLVTLYMASYVGHLYYAVMERQTTIILLGLTTLLGIWLGRRFQHSIYLVFAAVGIYLSPFLIHTRDAPLMDLVIYYSAWSLLFSFAALQEGRRLTYLLPMYLALLGFDVLWRISNEGEWQLAAAYQLLQFTIFSMTTVVFSVIHRDPVRENTTLAHGLALLIFYGIEYALLEQHVPELVNTIAIASAVVVFLLYRLATYFYDGEEALTQGAVLVSYYCSWVAVHAIFFGAVPDELLPWAVLFAPVVMFLVSPVLGENRKAMFPVTLACIVLFLFGYGSLVFDVIGDRPVATPLPTLALAAYTGMLYLVYFSSITNTNKQRTDGAMALYAGHLALMVCLAEWMARDVYLSALWACYAVALLVLAIQIKDKVLGQSALLIFTASGFKVLLFDLSDSNSMWRVLTLLVLSVCLYLGGWLYQSLARRA